MDVTTRHIKYQADCDLSFPAAIKSIPGCEKLDSCIQCGTCSGVCPMSIYMDMTPRRVMNLVRYGFKKEVMASNTIWLCSSCYACTVECPREIKVTDIMYALKQMAIREKAYPRRFRMVVLANEFYKMVRARGRVNEIHLVTRLNLLTNPLEMLKMARLGIELIRRGRFSLRPDAVKDPQRIREIMEYQGNGNGRKEVATK
ncbi:MAG: 4Fe-4S dicluster domain-containing protein [Candidatus Sumerlaea chitinivorans]|nr:4Fe-4S dicluster domain-containing protein [Candidatus Sumerlaea chitinivorans]